SIQCRRFHQGLRAERCRSSARSPAEFMPKLQRRQIYADSDRHRQLRELAAGTRDGAAVRRLLAIALGLEGRSRAEAARLNGMDRQTLRDWVHRYNEEGVEGLYSRASPGRPSALTDEQMEELRTLVLEGPDPQRHQVIRWRCADLRAEIIARWSV